MKVLKESTLIVCSIVRDAEHSLKVNIPVIDALCRYFKDYRIVVYENDSKDKTKLLLNQWADKDRQRIHVLLNDNDRSKTIPKKGNVACNPFFSRKRISKMVNLRNQYMEYVEKQGWHSDYLIVVDLDVAHLYVSPIIEAMSDNREWDVLTAFGFSLSPYLTRRYHDGYALTRLGEENTPQTEEMIYSIPKILGKLKPCDDWLKVYSAFGGLAIYKYDAIKDLRYEVLSNNDLKVEVHCEHFSIYKQIHERGYNNIYVVPSLILKYQAITPRLIWNTIKRKL